MIVIEYAKIMARYDSWQNQSLVAAADKLSGDDRSKDRRVWDQSLRRLTISSRTIAFGWPDSRVSVQRQTRCQAYTDSPRDWSEYKRQRKALDEEIRTGCEDRTDADVSRQVQWM